MYEKNGGILEATTMIWKGTTITSGVKEIGDYVGRFVSSNAHAQQTIPALHRLLSAGGMYLGWIGGDKVRDALFAVNQTSEGEFVEVKREEVPIILRPIYHKIEWNPHSDAPGEQWKKILHQTLPAATAAAGTLAGSEMVFQMNDRAAGFIAGRKSKELSLITADRITQYPQSRLFSVLTALTGGAGGASMLPIAYGAFLNLRFLLANGGKINLGNSAGGNLSPEKALTERIGKVAFYVKSATNSAGKIGEEWSQIFVKDVLKPIFGKNLDSPEKEEKIRKIIHGTFQKAYDELWEKGLRGEKLIEEVSNKMHNIMGDAKPVLNRGRIEYQGFDKYVQKDLGFNFDDITLGNSVSIIRTLTEWLAKTFGWGKNVSAEHHQNIIREQRRNAEGFAVGNA